MQIKPKTWDDYMNFIRYHCKDILCKDCPKYKGKCTHKGHPKQPLFTR